MTESTAITPALLTMMSRRPKAETVRSTQARTSASTVTSAATASAEPVFAISRAAASALSS